MAYKGEKRGLPIILHIAGRPVIVVGNGSEADTKRRLLTRAGARIVEEGSKALLAIVIDDAAAVSRLKVRGVLVHAVSRPDLSDFTLAGDDDQPVSTPRKATRSGMWGRLRGASAGPEPLVAADEAALPDVVPDKAVPEVARQPASGAADGDDPAAETAQTAGIGVMPKDPEPLGGQERPSRALVEPDAAVVGSDRPDVAVRAAQAVPTGEISRKALRKTNVKAANVAPPGRAAPPETVKELGRSAGQDEPPIAAPQPARTDVRPAEAEAVPHRPITEAPATPPADTATSAAANTEVAQTKTPIHTSRTHGGAGFSFATPEPARTEMVPLEVRKSSNAPMPPVEPVEVVTNMGAASAGFVLPEDPTSPSAADPKAQPVPEPAEVVSNMAVPPAGFVLHVREARGAATPEKELLIETVKAVTDPVVAPTGFVLPDSRERPVAAAVGQMPAATQAETAPAKPGQRWTRIVPNEVPVATGAALDTTAASFTELQESREPLRSLIAPLAASFGAAAAILRARVSGPKGGHVSLDMALRKGGPLDPTVADACPDGGEPAARPPE
jgi:hypothetical protein